MQLESKINAILKTETKSNHGLATKPWPHFQELVISTPCPSKPSSEIVLAVLKRQRDPKLALNYFRWVERTTGESHTNEAYTSLLMLISNSRKYDLLENVLQEMSLLGYGISSNACISLTGGLVKSKRLKDAFNLIQTLRKFKYQPVFSSYTALIGALSDNREPDLALSLFQQMQDIGYEVNVHLFTTLVRAFAREGKLDSALNLLSEMRSISLDGDLVLYNVCIDSFGKAGKLEMAWKFFNEIKSYGLVPDEVPYTSMIWVLCKAERIDEAEELFEDLERHSTVPCAYAYNTMIMGYGTVGRFDDSHRLLARLRIERRGVASRLGGPVASRCCDRSRRPSCGGVWTGLAASATDWTGLDWWRLYWQRRDRGFSTKAKERGMREFWIDSTMITARFWRKRGE